MTDAPRPDLDDAERRGGIEAEPDPADIGALDDAERLVRWAFGSVGIVACVLAEYDRRGAALADAQAEGVAAPGIDWRAAYEEIVGPAARAQYLDERVAALLRFCDEIDEEAVTRHPRGMLLTSEVRALLGGADNNNEGGQ